MGLGDLWDLRFVGCGICGLWDLWWDLRGFGKKPGSLVHLVWVDLCALQLVLCHHARVSDVFSYRIDGSVPVSTTFYFDRRRQEHAGQAHDGAPLRGLDQGLGL